MNTYSNVHIVQYSMNFTTRLPLTSVLLPITTTGRSYYRVIQSSVFQKLQSPIQNGSHKAQHRGGWGCGVHLDRSGSAEDRDPDHLGRPGESPPERVLSVSTCSEARASRGDLSDQDRREFIRTERLSDVPVLAWPGRPLPWGQGASDSQGPGEVVHQFIISYPQTAAWAGVALPQRQHKWHHGSARQADQGIEDLRHDLGSGGGWAGSSSVSFQRLHP